MALTHEQEQEIRYFIAQMFTITSQFPHLTSQEIAERLWVEMQDDVDDLITVLGKDRAGAVMKGFARFTDYLGKRAEEVGLDPDDPLSAIEFEEGEFEAVYRAYVEHGCSS